MPAPDMQLHHPIYPSDTLMVPFKPLIPYPAIVFIKTPGGKFPDHCFQFGNYLGIILFALVIEHGTSQIRYFARPADAHFILPDQMLRSFSLLAGL
jgi:hypothetical protein